MTAPASAAPGVRATLALLAAGFLLRVVLLPLWGTFDVEVQKAWSARAASEGLADIYGPSDAELIRQARAQGGSFFTPLLREQPRTRFTWGTGSYFVDYPPGSLLSLWAAGKLYSLFDPALESRRGFNAAVNLAPLLGSLAIAALLLASAPGAGGRIRSLAFWLNPAVILAAPVLGYQDPIFAALALLALLLLMRRRHVAAAVLVVAAGLVKPQGVLLLPTLLAVTLRETRPATWARAALGGTAAAALLLAPWWTEGHLLSALDGCRRPLSQTTLAPLGLNLWWIAGWAADATRGGLSTLARIVSMTEFRDLAGFDPRLPSRLLLTLATLANLALLLRFSREDRRTIPLSVVLQVHAYALFGTSVHENHTFLAVVLAPLLLGEWRHATKANVATSAFLFASLFFAAGWGRRITRQATLAALRRATLIDASVLVALAHIAFVAGLYVWVARTRPISGPGET